MEKALDLKWTFGEKDLSWKANGQFQSLRTDIPIRDVTALSDGSGFLLVQSLQKNSRATIFNIDGTKRVDIKMPKAFNRDEIFYYSEYAEGNLHLIVAGSDRDFGFYVDEKEGAISEMHEVR